MRRRCAASTSTAFRWWTTPPRPGSRPTMQASGYSGLARRCESAWFVGAARARRGDASTAPAASPAAPVATTATPKRNQEKGEGDASPFLSRVAPYFEALQAQLAPHPQVVLQA